jgi:type I pantothenate kinase
VSGANTLIERPFIAGVSGPVAVGKSTFAAELADRLIASDLQTAVVATDGFILSNAELDARGLAMRKGFPESFDATRLAQFLADARQGVAELRVPVYSHLTYDLVPGKETVIGKPDVLIVEGVNVLLPVHIGDLDLAIYLDAPEDDVVGWFSGRMAELCRAARDEPASFFRPYAGLSDDEVRTFARAAWDAINAVNLDLHIRPQRDGADVIVEKRSDHGIDRVAIRPARH